MVTSLSGLNIKQFSAFHFQLGRGKTMTGSSHVVFCEGSVGLTHALETVVTINRSP